jgi:hypothetical protein
MALLPRIAALLLLAAAPAGAQSVGGSVLDDDSDEPVRTVLVELRTDRGRALATTVTDSLGAFQMGVPGEGSYRLLLRRLGYQTVESPLFAVAAAEAVEVSLRIASTSISLTPLTITSRPEAPLNLMLERVGFYQRERRQGGTFLRRERIERNNGGRLSDVLSELPGVRRQVVRGVSVISLNRQRSCSPQVVLDGQPLIESTRIDDIVAIRSIEGIEVYRGPAEAPVEFAMRETGCGLLVIWTRGRR